MKRLCPFSADESETESEMAQGRLQAVLMAEGVSLP